MKYIEIDAAKAAARRAEADADYDGRRFNAECVADALDFTPTADVREVVYCKDCRYLPTGDSGDSGFDLEWPDEEDYNCPFHCPDGWYSQMPKPDFFCANGKHKEKTE